MKKRFLTAALTVALSLSTVCSVKAATPVDVHYNNWDMPVTGYLKDGTTYVPIRQFFQLLGGVMIFISVSVDSLEEGGLLGIPAKKQA